MPTLLFVLSALCLASLVWVLARSVRWSALVPAAPTNHTGIWRDAVGWPLLAGIALGALLQSFWAALLALAVSPLLPRWQALRTRNKLRADLAEQMPAFLEALTSGLRAGLSLPQALEVAVEDLPVPSAALARRLGDGLRLGEAPEALMLAEARALDGHALAADWRLLATAVSIQRSSGGDLAALLDQQTETLRERQRLQAQVEALTAQGRLSAWVVGLLPPALLLALHLMDPELVAPLFSTPTGWVLLGLGALMEGAGVLLLRRIVDIDA